MNQDDATISVLSSSTGSTLNTISLTVSSQPFGIAFSPTGNDAYVSLQGTGQLVRVDSLSRSVTGTLDLGPDANGIVPKARGVAVSADSSRVFVTRFISGAANGEVYEVAASTFSVTRTFTLANDPGDTGEPDPDTSFTGRGVPNYISSIAISPDGIKAWIPAKKDNTDLNTAVSGITVDVTFSGFVSGTASDSTNGSGEATLDSNKLKGTGTITVTVDNLTASGYIYDSYANAEDSDILSN